MSPLVSIVIPTFNREQTLPVTLASLRALENPQWECLLIDDGSEDGTLELLKEAQDSDPRFRWASRGQARAKGANACRNIGAEMAAGEWLLFLDSDDLLTPDCVGERISAAQALENWDYLVFTTEHRYTSETSGRVFNRDPKVESREAYLGLFLSDQVPWHTTSPLWQRSSFLDLGGFDESLQRHQDADLHVRALMGGLYFKRVHNPADNVWLIGAEHRQRGFDWFRRKLVSTFAYLEICGDLLEKSALKAEMLPYWRYFWFRIYKDNFCWHPGQLKAEEQRFWELAERYQVFDSAHKRALGKARKMVWFRLKTGKRWLVGLERKLDQTFEHTVNQLG